MSSLKELSYLASKIEFMGICEALLAQIEIHGELLTEEQVQNWQKIAHYGFLFVDQCEDNWVEIAAKNVKIQRQAKQLAELQLKVQELRTENARLMRMKVELSNTISKGFRT